MTIGHFEDFDERWPAGSGLVPAFDPSDLSAATFVGTGSVETFESGWRGNESYVWHGTWSSWAFFNFAHGSGQFEAFASLSPDLEDVTVDPATDTFTSVAHGLTGSDSITLRNEGGRLPSGVLASTRYRVRNETADTFQISATGSSPIIDETDVGFGTHYAKHDPAFYWTEELEGV